MDHTARQGDYAEYHCAKDMDACERIDSGYDSYNSMPYDESRSTSLQHPTVDNISSQMSTMILTNVSTANSALNNFNLDDKAAADERCDSAIDPGYESFKSGEILSFQKPVAPTPEPTLEEQIAENPFLQCFVPDDDGDNYLQLAVIQRRTDVAFNIIQMCNVPQFLDVANSEQQTALHLAVLTDQPKLTRCLVAYGADVTCKDKFGNTPLHLACERGLMSHVDMLTSKLDVQEDPGLQRHPLPQNVNERNYLGFTPLHLAVCNDQVHVVRFLIHSLKCDVDLADLKSGRTALHHAIERRSMESMKQIMSAHANINALTYDECSPLHLAAARGLRNETNYLLKKGADLFLITRDDQDIFELSEHNQRLQKMLRDAERKHNAYQRSIVG